MKDGRDRRTAPAPCPCGGPAAYADCCGPWHAGPMRLAAPDAERLMRSRYAAWTMGLEDYLLDTWHPLTRPAALGVDPAGVRWLGLDVRAHRRVDDTHAVVEFVARSRVGGRGQRLHELSRFVREAGRWWYVDGEIR